MRKSFQLPLLAAMSLVAILAFAACGDDDGNGGTGGTGGTAGAGGTGGNEPPDCEAACDHVTDDCLVVFTKPDGSKGDKQDCLRICAAAADRVVDCFTNVTCGDDGPQNVAAVEACVEHPGCDAACAHVFVDCSLEPWTFSGSGETLTQADCVNACNLSFSDSQITCLKDVECDLAEVQACE